jgi:beta-glucanase (GH16 family)
MTRIHICTRAFVAVALLVLLGSCSSRNSDLAGPAEAEWSLVWSDEFNGAAGQSPDPGKWAYDIGTDWGNRQLEWTTDRPENVSMDGNGNLAIVAREESFQGQPYTSARIKTQGLFEQRYGRFEARIRVPAGQGLWPAFWMLGANIDEVGWPQSGEIDIMEFLGQEVNVLHGTLHGPGHFGDNAFTRRYVYPDGRLDTDFHVYSVEWEADEIRWYLDGQLYHQARRGQVPGQWVYDHEFFMILNLAVGGNWPGPVGPNVTFPRTLLVDWVRVYELAR